MFLTSFKSRYPALLRLIQKFFSHKIKLVSILILGLIVSSIQPIAVRVSEQMVTELQKGQALDPAFFQHVPLTLIGLFVLSGLAKYFYNTFRRILSENIIAEYREELYRKYLLLPLSVIDRKRTGELLAGLQNDLSQISVGVDTISTVLKEPFTFLGLIGVAFYCEWRLTLATLLVAPIVALLFSRTGGAVKRYSTRNLENFSSLLSLAQESLVGSRIVKMFGLEKRLADRFVEIQKSYLSTIHKSIRVQELATPLVEFVGALLIAGVIYYAGTEAAKGTMTSGQLVGFIIAIGLAQMPIKELNNSFLKLKNAEAAAERLFRILDEKESKVFLSGKRPVQTLNREIKFQNVTLAYTEGVLALNQVSFEIKKGETVALIGQSGSGKTSIVNLLPRLYEFNSGEILIDGVPIQEFCLEDLRKLFAFVNQEPFLFHDSIYKNVSYGNPHSSKAEVEEACRLAYCNEFIKTLPDGMDTVVGDRGVMLSGGERQRISIARAFLRKAPILVLDEATSNLDSHSESVVQQALGELARGKTTLVIAHRLSTIRSANKIFIFNKGELVDSGTHMELLEKSSHYSEALALQL